MPASVYGQLILTPSRGYWCVENLNTLSFSADLPLSKKISQSPPHLRQRQAAPFCWNTQLFLPVQAAGTCSLKSSLVPVQRVPALSSFLLCPYGWASELSSFFQCPFDGYQSAQAFSSAHSTGIRALKLFPVPIRWAQQTFGESLYTLT